MFQATKSFAQHLDTADPLAHFRAQFVHDDPDLIYLDGNSLGRLPKKSVALAQKIVAKQWGQRLIRSWNEGWLERQVQIGDKIGQLIGAEEGEVIIADSTSINLFKLAVAALQYNADRHKIVTDDLNFPSDLYILQGIRDGVQRPLKIQIVPSEDGLHGSPQALAQAIDADTALVLLSHTTFKSAYTYDLTAVSQLADNTGALIIWDISHSVGAIEIDVQAANIPLAIGCTYKYLNGGPGAPAFLYIRKDWQQKLNNPITGWMGQNKMFDFDLTYQRDPSLRHFLSGTPSILSTALIEPGVDLLLQAGMANLRAKSVQQSNYLIYLWQRWLKPFGFKLHSPQEAQQRGSHVSLSHPEGARITQALIHNMHVIPDFRQPDNIRFGIAPLYTSYRDIYEAMSRLRTIMNEQIYKQYNASTEIIT